MKSDHEHLGRSGNPDQASTCDRDRFDPVDRDVTHIVFLLLDNFSLISYASAIEPLRLANKALKRVQYAYSSVSFNGQPVTASNGTTVACDDAMSEVTTADLLIVCSSDDVEHVRLPKGLAVWCRNLERRGAQLGGICTGAYVLARLGLLDGHACTIHWEYAATFSETFPDIFLTQNLVEQSGRRITCAGGTAPLDLMLQFIRTRHGEAAAGTIADLAIHHRQRDTQCHQRVSIRERLGICEPVLLNSIDAMERNIETALSLDDLARCVGVSTRQLQRTFKTHGLAPPSQYYLQIRLDRARELLRRTSMSVSEIVYACGFASPSHFSRRYRDYHGVCPHRDRGMASER